MGGYLCVCACVRACVRVCVCVCVLICTSVCHSDVWSSIQVDLTEPILSRFDVLCVVRDTVDPVEVGGSIVMCIVYQY